MNRPMTEPTLQPPIQSTGQIPLPPAIEALLEIFAGDLAEVHFPGIDAAVLDQAVERVRECSVGVGHAEAALELARAALGESEEALGQKAQRALAYARVFAEDDADLSGRLDALALPRTVRRARVDGGAGADPSAASGTLAPRRRGRPRADGCATLFIEPTLPAPPPSPSSPEFDPTPPVSSGIDDSARP